jgi:hypothetical protein
MHVLIPIRGDVTSVQNAYGYCHNSYYYLHFWQSLSNVCGKVKPNKPEVVLLRLFSCSVQQNEIVPFLHIL